MLCSLTRLAHLARSLAYERSWPENTACRVLPPQERFCADNRAIGSGRARPGPPPGARSRRSGARSGAARRRGHPPGNPARLGADARRASRPACVGDAGAGSHHNCAPLVQRFQNSNHMRVIPGRGRRRRPRARNPVITAAGLLDSGLASASLRRPGMTSFYRAKQSVGAFGDALLQIVDLVPQLAQHLTQIRF